MPGDLHRIQSFAIYYGHGQEERLSTYDLAVVAPGWHSPERLHQVQSQGTQVLAYVSVLEVPRQDGQPPPPNVLMDRGVPQANPHYPNWILDPRAPATRERLVRLAEQLLGQKFDGLFLDTMADMEDFLFSGNLASELIPATAWLVAEISRAARCTLVQNRGFHRLLPLTAPYLDGACWESFPYRRIGPIPSLHSGVRAVQRLKQAYGLRILALNEGVDQPKAQAAACAAARRCGFLWYGTPRYVDLPQPCSRSSGISAPPDLTRP